MSGLIRSQIAVPDKYRRTLTTLDLEVRDNQVRDWTIWSQSTEVRARHAWCLWQLVKFVVGEPELDCSQCGFIGVVQVGCPFISTARIATRWRPYLPIPPH